MPSETRKQLEDWLAQIEVKGGRVLDIGGSQNPLSKSRLKVFEPDEHKILDLEEPHEYKVKPDIVLDLNKELLKEWKGTTIQQFNIVFCLEVFEYIWDPAQAMRNLWWLTVNGGTLYLSFHFLYPHHNPEGKDMLRYTYWGVEKLLKETGFEIEEIVPRVAKNYYKLEDWFRDERMRPSQAFKGHHHVGYLVRAKKK